MIRLENVRKTFDGTLALDSISFEVGKGSACGYVGPNGAGKSTTAKILVGLEKADSGRVTVMGREISRTDPAAVPRIGYVPESPRLYDSLTPSETIAVAALLRRYEKKKTMGQLDILSEIFAFKDFLHIPVGRLSKGSRQKVVLSLAFLFHPGILVLDEPTDGLDVQAIAALKQFMSSFTSRGGTILYCSHLLDIVESVCDKVYMINRGRIAGEYRKSDFRDRRGYLENAFMENVGTRNEQGLIDAFFENPN